MIAASRFPLSALLSALLAPVLPTVLPALLAVAILSTAATAHAEPLPREVAAALRRADIPPEAFAVVVQEVGNGTAPPPPRLQNQAASPLNPASLFKLLTTSAALDLLGPAWTWTTPVWLQGNVHDGMLDGSLVIKGTGDPTLVLERVWLLLRRVRQLGVTDIRGDIVLDRSGFAAASGNAADFDGEPLKPYNVQPDALMLNYQSVTYTFVPDSTRNLARVIAEPALAGVAVDAVVPLAPGPCNDWRAALKASFTDATQVHFGGSYPAACGERNWPVAHAQPRLYDARLLEALWREMGGTLRGTVHDGPAPDSVAPTFSVASPPLAEVIRDINKFSNNVMAQQLFLTLGSTQRGDGSPAAARQVVRQWLANRVGAESAADAVIDNGNGLSRDARVTARLLARLLQQEWSSGTMPELMSSLPVTGVDGTMRHTAAPTGRAHLKTGSLRDVNGIAGYVLAQSGRRYVVVGLINHPNAPAGHAALDALAQWAYDDMPAGHDNEARRPVAAH